MNIVGFSVYAYEGIGIIIPVYDVTEKKELFPKILMIVLTMVFLSYCGFGVFCYIVYGKELQTPLITDNIPKNWFTSAVKIIFCFNLIFTYPLVIYPAFQVIEHYLFHKWPKSKKRMWSKNIVRVLVISFTIVIALILDKKLTKFISLIGGVACVPITFSLPTIFHYKICAKTTKQKRIDIALFILSIIIAIFCTVFCIVTWND